MDSTNELLEQLLVTSNRLVRIAARATGSTTPASFWRTLSILTSDGPLRVGDLARASRVSQPTMTKLQQQLVELGLAERIADADDSRASLIAVTPAGEAALDDWRHQLADALRPAFQDLTDAETAVLSEAVGILRQRTEITTGKVA
jgi:DNA-binding MarR family transcriptional regulator